MVIPKICLIKPFVNISSGLKQALEVVLDIVEGFEGEVGKAVALEVVK